MAAGGSATTTDIYVLSQASELWREVEVHKTTLPLTDAANCNVPQTGEEWEEIEN